MKGTLLDRAVAICFFGVWLWLGGQGCAPLKADEKPKLKALLIAGGCCHDYQNQVRILSEGIQKRSQVRVDVLWTQDGSTNPPLPVFDRTDWAEGYDVVIHDHCAADNKDLSVMQRILDVHQTLPAVHLHCAMHGFRNGTELWFQHLGLGSNSHGPQEPIEIEWLKAEHPILEGLKAWKTGPEELYNNLKNYGAIPIARGTQRYLRDGREVVDQQVVAWVTERESVRTFSTTLGHNTDTVADARYLDLVTRGLLWACDKLDADHLEGYQGEHTIRLMAADGEGDGEDGGLPKPPDGATLVKTSASTEETGRHNYAWRAIDGDMNSRWCASDGRYPQWWQIDFPEQRSVETVQIHWEHPVAYQFVVEVSTDGTAWETILDASQHATDEPEPLKVSKVQPAKSLRVRALGTKKGQWCSIREVKLGGKGLDKLFPEIDPALAGLVPGLGGDRYAKRGNIEPRVEKLGEAAERSILEDFQVPEGFEATIFAAPPAVNYPVFVAAAPDGTLYVSSDGNGSLGRDPGRGRVIRLRDLDGDGRADESKVFCTIDAPRGLVWDRDRLYLMHPPHLSAFIDHNGDGQADEQKVLVRDLAFGYDDRPADHTTNGLSLGMDGWLYIAGGDFGVLKATGSDGATLTHRGGGVLRCRTDGSGLEVYATGTRNILEVAISPQMELFARDNTNDGGGWNVRFHHFVGGEDRGYPRRYVHFPEDCLPPLADYGGGSGCGAVYIDEPGWGPWNKAPLTADWGTGALFHHQVEADGATYRETRDPVPMVKMTRPTDADIDAFGKLYCASWRGATFSWEGPRVGYIVQVRPKDASNQPLLDYRSASVEQLMEELDGPSYRRRLAAIRELQSRGESKAEGWLAKQLTQRTPERQEASKIFQMSGEDLAAAMQSKDPVLSHLARQRAIRLKADQLCIDAAKRHPEQAPVYWRALGEIHTMPAVDALLDQLNQHSSPEVVAALCRLYFREAVWTGDSWGTRPDTRGPYYELEAWEGTLRISEALEAFAEESDFEQAVHLQQVARKHRIPLEAPRIRLLQLATEDQQYADRTLEILATSEGVPENAMEFLEPLTHRTQLGMDSRQHLVASLGKIPEAEAILGAIRVVGETWRDKSFEAADKERLTEIFLKSPNLPFQEEWLEELAEERSDPAWLSAATLLQIAGNSDAPQVFRQGAQRWIDQQWADAEEGKLVLLEAIAETRNRAMAPRVLEALSDPNGDIQALAQVAADRLGVRRIPDETPRAKEIGLEEFASRAMGMQGDATLGELVFMKSNCAACHTVDTRQQPKGPYLGNIAKTYPRDELARNIAFPNRTIAQGFKTETFLTDESQVLTGFVVREAADQVAIRDSQGKEHQLEVASIVERKALPVSSMPDGLLDSMSVLEFASLLDYLQALAQKQ